MIRCKMCMNEIRHNGSYWEHVGSFKPRHPAVPEKEQNICGINHKKGIIMEAKYDEDKIELSPRLIEALKELMWAEMEMMRNYEPENADCWAWGICEINDLMKSSWARFYYGGEDDKPEDFPENTDVWVKI